MAKVSSSTGRNRTGDYAGAHVDPADDESFQVMETALLEELEGISTTILLFTDWDERRARMMDELQRGGTATRGFLISNNEEKAHKLPETVRWLQPELIEAGIDVL